MNPPSQSLSHIYFLGPQSSLGLYYYPVLMPCFTVLFTIARGAPVLFRNKCGMFWRYRQAQSHFRVSSHLQPLAQISGSVSEPANFVAGNLVGCPPEIKYETCECSVVMPRWVFIWFFPRLIVRVLIFVHPCRVKLSESRVRGYGRLGAQYLDHRQL